MPDSSGQEEEEEEPLEEDSASVPSPSEPDLDSDDVEAPPSKPSKPGKTAAEPPKKLKKTVAEEVDKAMKGTENSTSLAEANSHLLSMELRFCLFQSRFSRVVCCPVFMLGCPNVKLVPR